MPRFSDALDILAAAHVPVIVEVKASPDHRRGELCRDCVALTDYVETRIGRCPFMATKTFCSQCRVHCYAPAQRAAIKDVMRYAGPRMLLRHPVMTIHHGIDTLRAKRE